MKKNIFIILSIAVFLFMLNACRRKVESNIDNNNKSKIVKLKGKYICISLSRYVNEVYKRVTSGAKVPSDIDTLFGMSWIDGYVIDNQKKDIILVGEQKKSWPVYHSEDIFINYQNVFDNEQAPYCSLDPSPKNITILNKYMAVRTGDLNSKVRNCQAAIGSQKVVIGGVPLNSRAAKIMIYADYDMKKISQGLIKAPGINSIIDLSVADSANSSSSKATMSRFWLHIKQNEKNKVYPNYRENKDIVFINECPVIVLTEKQYVDPQGKIKDNLSEKDKIGTAFAASMGENYSVLASKNVLFAELENMFRLQACLVAMRLKEAIQNSGVDLSNINGLRLAKGNELPPSLPGLINYKLLQNKKRIAFFIVAGGVSQEMKVDSNNLHTDNSNLLIKTDKAVIKNRPDTMAIYWYAKVVN